jgi:hypothetical protein
LGFRRRDAPEGDEEEMIAKNILRCSVTLCLSAALACPNLWAAQANDPISLPAEEIVSTPTPQSHLAFDVWAPVLAGLEAIGPEALASPIHPAPNLPAGPGFWNVAESSLFATTLLSFAGLNVADYFLTREALKYPETGETNPVLRPIVRNALTFALFKAGYIALNTLGLASLHRSDKPMAWALTMATNVLVVLAVSHNLTQLDKVKNR